MNQRFYRKLGIWAGLALLIGSLSACSVQQFSWRTTSYDSHAVWADDAADIAVARLSYEQKQSFDPLSGTTDKRDFRHQIWVQQPDGSGRRAVTPLRPHQIGKIYYMRRAGYLLVESLLAEPGAAYLDKLDLRGGAPVRLLEVPPLARQACPGDAVLPPSAPGLPPESPGRIDYAALPSPDGSYLALAFSPACGKAQVELRRADNLEVVWRQDLNLPEPVNLTWHPAGHLILAGFRQAWRIDLDGGVSPSALPACVLPATSSSEISAHRRVLVPGAEGIEVVHSDDMSVFGCQ